MDSVVETRYGKLKGRRTDAGHHVFRGIPYASPPVGELRFRAPEPPEPWSGIREATASGPIPPQPPLPIPGAGTPTSSEDCLTLNVFTPGLDGASRPVLVWIHGGAFVIGSGSMPLYDGGPLARRGDVVVVTLNYRLGPLGFLYLGDLLPDLEGAAGNEGIRDQVAALEWVRDHIEAFGGDPGNVTIFGESAGGMSVGTLLAVPSASGLFHRAIAQSGATHNFHTRESASAVAESFLDSLGLSRAEATGALRSLPADRLLDDSRQAMFKLGSGRGLLPFQPLVDGDFLPERPLDAIRAGHSAPVTVMTGTTRDEWRMFALLDPDVPRIDEAGLVEKLRKRIPEVDADQLVETYRKAREGRAPCDAPSLFFAIETDRVFRIPAIRLAEAQCAHHRDTYMYRFDWESPAFDGSLGACHAIDLLFVFGTLDLPMVGPLVGSGPDAEALCERTMDAWISFARAGTPGHPGLGEWPAYEPERRATMALGAECRLEEDPGAEERHFWEGVL